MLLNKNIIYILLVTIVILGNIIFANFIFLNRKFQIKNHSKKFDFSWSHKQKLISCLKEISAQKQQPIDKIVLIIEDTNFQTPFARTIYEKKRLLKISLYLPDSILIKKDPVEYARAVYTNLIVSLMEHFKSQDKQNCLYKEYLETRDVKKQYLNISLRE